MIHHGEDFWREKFTEWKRSGQSISTFCKTHGLVPSSFYKWKRKLLGRSIKVNASKLIDSDQKPEKLKPAFVEVALPSNPTARVLKKNLRITTSYGAVIEVPL